MYVDFFELDDYPFRLTPDLDYLYMSSGHARAKAYVDYSMVSKDGFVVITGEVGAGKTTLMRQLLGEITEDTVVVHIENTLLTQAEFLQTVTQELLGEIDTSNKVDLLRKLRTCLHQAHSRDLRIIIAVDEAQALSYEVLEELRLLAGLEAKKEKLISVVLMGQPDLDRVLDSPEMEQLRQRIRLRFHLSGLSPDESRTYIRHRLEVAGAPDPDAIFDDSAYGVIDVYTGGIPRLINTLCDMAMLTAYVDEQTLVDEDIVHAAVEELGWEPYSQRATSGMVDAAAGQDGHGSSVPQIGALNSLTEAVGRLENSMQAIERHLGRIADAVDNEGDAVRRRGA